MNELVISFLLLLLDAAPSGKQYAFALTSVPGNTDAKKCSQLNSHRKSSEKSREFGKTLSEKFRDSNGILYKKSILTASEFDVIRKELVLPSQRDKRKGGKYGTLGLTLTQETSSSVAIKRNGATLPWDCETVKILGDPSASISRLVNTVISSDLNSFEKRSSCHSNSLEMYTKKMVLSRQVPVEMRVYDQIGSGMEWHVDDILFSTPQIEVVLTIENSSDCETMWEETKQIADSSVAYSLNAFDVNSTTSKKIQNLDIKSVQTEPNSILLIQAGGVKHKVSSLKNCGRRVILKFVFVHDDEDNVMTVDSGEQHLHQFEGKKANRRNKIKKRKR